MLTGSDPGFIGSLVQAISYNSKVDVGLRVSEKALPEGTPVTIVAEALSSTPGGRIILRAPANGKAFVISIGNGSLIRSSISLNLESRILNIES